MAITIVGVAIHIESDDAKRLARCLIRRLSGDPDAEPPMLEPDTYPIRVMVDHGGDPWAFAEAQRDECAGELGIAEPWELVHDPAPGIAADQSADQSGVHRGGHRGFDSP
jgi:hypothetical protein